MTFEEMMATSLSRSESEFAAANLSSIVTLRLHFEMSMIII